MRYRALAVRTHGLVSYLYRHDTFRHTVRLSYFLFAANLRGEPLCPSPFVGYPYHPLFPSAPHAPRWRSCHRCCISCGAWLIERVRRLVHLIECGVDRGRAYGGGHWLDGCSSSRADP